MYGICSLQFSHNFKNGNFESYKNNFKKINKLIKAGLDWTKLYSVLCRDCHYKYERSNLTHVEFNKY